MQGHWSELGKALLVLVCAVAYVFAATWAILWFTDKLIALRVSGGGSQRQGAAMYTQHTCELAHPHTAIAARFTPLSHPASPPRPPCLCVLAKQHNANLLNRH